MDEITQQTKHYPRFSEGRIDYSNEKVCFVINCVVVCGDEILLTKRGHNGIAYPGAINGVSGFIDRTDMSLKEQAKLELREELKAPLDKIIKLYISEPFVQTDEEIGREWHVYAVLAEFNQKFEPIINWENKEAAWYRVGEAKQLDLMKGFRETLETALSLRK